MKKNKTKCACGVLVLFLVFLILKLCGVVAWSWWWVTAPLWLPVVLATFLIMSLILYLCIHPTELNEKEDYEL